MLPYLLLLAASSGPAIMAIRRSALLILLVALLYWFMIGWRFQIGVDWNNYVHMYNQAKSRPLGELIADAEPGFRALLWLASITGGGVIFVNVVSALVFCWGLFAMARRCLEPFLALAVATPYVVVVVGMSGVRQAMAAGILYFLFAKWERFGTLGRTMLVLFAGLFHLSAVLNGAFVALGSRMSPPARIATAALVAGVMMGIFWLYPERFEFYSEAYVGERRLSAPGAVAHVALLAAPALVYLVVRGHWQRILEQSELFKYLAVASLLTIPAVYLSSVGASRISIYFWPIAMYVWSGLPALLRSEAARYLYRVAVVAGCALVLILWLDLANSSWAYLPYRNWWWEPEQSLLRRGRF